MSPAVADLATLLKNASLKILVKILPLLKYTVVQTPLNDGYSILHSGKVKTFSECNWGMVLNFCVSRRGF